MSVNLEAVVEEVRSYAQKHRSTPNWRTRILANDILTLLDGKDLWEGFPPEPKHRKDTPPRTHGRHAA